MHADVRIPNRTGCRSEGGARALHHHPQVPRLHASTNVRCSRTKISGKVCRPRAQQNKRAQCRSQRCLLC